MISKLLELDKDLFIYLNSFHTPWLDPVMYYMSETFVWSPLYILLLYLIYKNYQKDTWLILIGITLTVLFSDQLTTSVMKPFFMRLRPSHEPLLSNTVHVVNGYRSGGLYGFASSHAADTFGAAMFLWLLLKPHYRWSVLLFLWAALVTYTRIYLGVHYPGDVLAGAAIGIFFGWIFYTSFKLIKGRIDGRKSDHLTNVT